jgi:hypothetical protein
MTSFLSSEFQEKLEKADTAARPVVAMQQHVLETATTVGVWGPASMNYKMVNVSVPLHTTKDTALLTL